MPFAIGLREHSPLGAVLKFALVNKEVLGDRAQEQKYFSCKIKKGKARKSPSLCTSQTESFDET